MKNSNQLTAVIIAKNEEPRIERCLKSVSFADEILLIDNGSVDKTVEIARNFGVTVVSNLSQNFSILRNLGKMHALGEWILYIDADEEVPKELKEEIQNIIRDKSGINCYYISRKNYYLGTEWPIRDKMQRFFKKSALLEWYGELHETAKVLGESGELKNPLIHRTHRTLSEMTEKTNTWSNVEAKLRFDAHHPPIVGWRLVRVMISAFWVSYVTEKGYKAGTAGFIEALFQSFSMFLTYAKLWEMQQKNI